MRRIVWLLRPRLPPPAMNTLPSASRAAHAPLRATVVSPAAIQLGIGRCPARAWNRIWPVTAVPEHAMSVAQVMRRISSMPPRVRIIGQVIARSLRRFPPLLSAANRAITFSPVLIDQKLFL